MWILDSGIFVTVVTRVIWYLLFDFLLPLVMIGKISLKRVSVRECLVREIGDGIDSGRLCREK